MICVYKILSPDLQECYVGSTTNFKARVYVHKSCRTCQSKVLFDKYGFVNCTFVILEQCEKSQLLEKEKYWLECSVGAVNSRDPIGLEHSVRCKKYNVDNRKKIAERKRKYNLEYGKKNYEANKEKRLENQRKYRAKLKSNPK